MSEKKVATGETPKVEAVDDDPQVVIYPPEGKLAETAAALVEAAEAEGHDQQRIVLSDGTFIVPQSLADAATLPEGTDEADAELAAVAVSEGQDGQKPPAKSTGEAGINSPQLTPGGSTEEERAAEAEKRAPAKKAPAKKAPAKKAPAKKTAG